MRPASAFGQIINPDAETSAARSARPARTGSRLRRAAKRRAVEGGGEVTFQAVLADPDNMDLNFRYARAQVGRGNLKGAAATLERVLMVNPKLHQVRLLYALVLFRLDNINDAERELKALAELKLPDAVRAEVDDFLKKIAKKRRKTNVSGTLSLGFDWDTNRNSSPFSKQRLIGDRLVDLTGSNLKVQDTSIVTVANTRITHDPGSQAGHELFLSLTYFRAEQTVADNLDLVSYAGQTGLIYKGDWAEVTPAIAFDHVRLSEDTFLRQPTVSLRVERKVSGRFSVHWQGSAQYQQYDRTRDIAVAPERDGAQYETGVGASYLLTPTQRVAGAYAYVDKDSARRYNSFERSSFHLSHSWFLGKGRFFTTSAQANIDHYYIADRAISPRIRKDETFRVRLTYGHPLGLLHKSLKDFLWTGGFEYYASISTLANYAYDNDKLTTMLTYRWEL